MSPGALWVPRAYGLSPASGFPRALPGAAGGGGGAPPLVARPGAEARSPPCTPPARADFEGQACLSLAEAAAILKESEERRAAPGTEQQLHPSTRKALRYAERFRRGEEAGAAQARKALEASGLRPFEAGALATLAPETAEVAMALQPSIQLGPEELQSSLDQLAANLTFS